MYEVRLSVSSCWRLEGDQVVFFAGVKSVGCGDPSSPGSTRHRTQLDVCGLGKIQSARGIRLAIYAYLI